MKEILLSGSRAAGRVALVDDEDYELVSRYSWAVSEQAPTPRRRRNGPYAWSTSKADWDKKVFMHVLIMGFKGVDHIDHDGLNNQRSNLRAATARQNSHNRRPQQGSSSRYKGVTWHRRCRKWQALIQVEGRSRYLGVFVSEEDAARAYNAAAAEAHGPYAYLNRVIP